MEPDHPRPLRGRLAGVEMLSYSIGPSAGQLRAGGVASLTSPRVAAWSGGLLCVGAVGVVCLALPGFTRYSSRASLSPAPTGQPEGPAPGAALLSGLNFLAGPPESASS